MTEEPLESENICYFFLKILTFWKNGDFGKKVDFFLAILTFLISTLEAQQNFMPARYLFLSISIRSKGIAFFVKNLPKLNTLSVIAID